MLQHTQRMAQQSHPNVPAVHFMIHQNVQKMSSLREQLWFVVEQIYDAVNAFQNFRFSFMLKPIFTEELKKKVINIQRALSAIWLQHIFSSSWTEIFAVSKSGASFCIFLCRFFLNAFKREKKWLLFSFKLNNKNVLNAQQVTYLKLKYGNLFLSIFFYSLFYLAG